MSHQSEVSRWWKEREAELRPLLFEWDVIGFAKELPEDEYDCVAAEVLTALTQRQATADDLEALLRKEASEHFGLTPVGNEKHIAERIREWFERAPAVPSASAR